MTGGSVSLPVLPGLGGGLASNVSLVVPNSTGASNGFIPGLGGGTVPPPPPGYRPPLPPHQGFRPPAYRPGFRPPPPPVFFCFI